MQHDGIVGVDRTDVIHPVPSTIQLAEDFATAVEPQVRAVSLRPFGVVAFRNHQAIGLDRAVDFGDVAADVEAGAVIQDGGA